MKKLGLVLLAFITSTVACTKKTKFENSNSLNLKSLASISNCYSYNPCETDQKGSYIKIDQKCGDSVNLKFEYSSELANDKSSVIVACPDPKGTVTARLPVSPNDGVTQHFKISVKGQGVLSATLGMWSSSVEVSANWLWNPDDHIAPTLAISGGPIDGSVTADPAPKFTLTGTDLGGSGMKEYFCAIDNGSFAPCIPGADNTGVGQIVVTIPASTILHTYTLHAYATDGADNKSDEKTVTWTYDPTVPLCSLVSATPAFNIWTKATQTSRTYTVHCSNSPTKVDCKLSDPAGNQTITDCSNDKLVTVPLNNTINGTFTLDVVATSSSGGAPGTLRSKFSHDGKPPTSPAFQTNFCSEIPHYQNTAGVSLTATGYEMMGADANGDPLQSGYKSNDCVDTSATPSPVRQACSQSFTLTEGLHIFKTIALDNAGNETAQSGSCQVFYDKTAPTLSLAISATDSKGIIITANETTDKDVKFAFQFSDGPGSGIQSVECSVTNSGVAPISGNPCTTLSSFDHSAPSTGDYDFNVRAKDYAGNFSAWSKYSWTYKLVKTTPVMTSFSLGEDHGCAVLDHRLYCWGGGQTKQNGYGGNEIQAKEPIPGFSDTVEQVASGGNFSCLLTKTPAETHLKAHCFGANADSQIGGYGPQPSQRAPIQGDIGYDSNGYDITDYTDRDVDLARVVTESGNLSNVYLPGTSKISCNNKFVDLTAVTQDTSTGNGANLGFTYIAAGSNFACGIDNSSKKRLWCWGENFYGQLGNGNYGTYGQVSVPQLVGNASAFVSGGQPVGDPNCNAGAAVLDVKLPPLENVKKVALGDKFGCAIATSLKNNVEKYDVLCWGSGGSKKIGEFWSNLNGYGTTQVPGAYSLFSSVKGNFKIKDLDVGHDHACAIISNWTPDGNFVPPVTDAIVCWGKNVSGQVGNGLNGSAQPPIDPNTLYFNLVNFHYASTGFKDTPDGSPAVYDFEAPFSKIAAGKDTSCVVTSVGHTYCWGENNFNQAAWGGSETGFYLPNFTTGSASSRVYRSQMVNAPYLATTFYPASPTAPALSTSFRLSSSPTTDVYLGSAFGCIMNGGRIYCWGSNGSGKLGIGYNGINSGDSTDIPTETSFNTDMTFNMPF